MKCLKQAGKVFFARRQTLCGRAGHLLFDRATGDQWDFHKGVFSETRGPAPTTVMRGSTLGRRVLGKVFTAPVTTTQGPADRVAIRARLGRTSASGVRLRVVYRSADGTLCDASLTSAETAYCGDSRPHWLH